MLPSVWRRWLERAFPFLTIPPRKKKGRRCRLLLEHLEDRLVPAPVTINVIGNGTTDSTGSISGGPNTFTATTLRGAVTQAETLSGDVIINLRNQGYILSIGELPALNDGGLNLTIQDNQGGLATINPRGSSRIFEVDAGTLTINHLRLVNGVAPVSDGFGGAIVLNFSQTVSASPTVNVENSQLSSNEALGSSDGISGSAGWGGAIANLAGTLSISNSTLSNNTARGGATAYGGGDAVSGEGAGGAVYIGGEGGPTSIVASTLSGNKAIGGDAALTGGNSDSTAFGGAGLGGAVYDDFGGSLHLVNSTLAYNVAQGGRALNQAANPTTANNSGFGGSAYGGAVGIPAGFGSTLTNDTIAFNSARSQPGFGSGPNGTAQGGGVFTGGEGGAGLEPLNTIIADNAVAGTSATDPDVSGIFVDQGHNLIGKVGDATGFAAANGDLFGDPGLSNVLASNGAPANAPPTLALLPTSRAVDHGDNRVLSAASPTGDIVTTDERGVKRPQPPGGVVDIGAYELVKAAFPAHGRDILPGFPLPASFPLA